MIPREDKPTTTTTQTPPPPPSSSGTDYTIMTPDGPVTIRNVRPEQTGERLVVDSRGTIYTGPAGGAVTPVQSKPDDKPLDIQRAVYDQRTDDIAFQVTASQESQKKGVYTVVDTVKNNPHLSKKQKDQLIAYVKAHPEQQHFKRTADTMPEPVVYDTGPADSIMLTDDQGISRPAVKNAEGKYELIKGVPDPFEAGAAVNEQQQDAGRAPFIMPWMIGNALGVDTYHKAAVLEPDMTVYPMPADVATIYPANIVFSRELDPRSGYYAVGIEGTLQPNIYYDPASGRFYNRFINEPMRAIDVMSYTPLWQGGASGVQVMQLLIDSNMPEKIDTSAMIIDEQSDFTVPDFGTVDEKGRFVSSTTPKTGSQDAQTVFKNIGIWGMDLSAGIEHETMKFSNDPKVNLYLHAADIGIRQPQGTSKSILLGLGDAASMLTGGTVTAVGAVGFLATGGISSENLIRGFTEGVPVMGYNIGHGFLTDPKRAAIGYGTTLVIGSAAGGAAGKAISPYTPKIKLSSLTKNPILADETASLFTRAPGRSGRARSIEVADNRPHIDLTRQGKEIDLRGMTQEEIRTGNLESTAKRHAKVDASLKDAMRIGREMREESYFDAGLKIFEQNKGFEILDKASIKPQYVRPKPAGGEQIVSGQRYLQGSANYHRMMVKGKSRFHQKIEKIKAQKQQGSVNTNTNTDPIFNNQLKPGQLASNKPLSLNLLGVGMDTPQLQVPAQKQSTTPQYNFPAPHDNRFDVPQKPDLDQEYEPEQKQRTPPPIPPNMPVNWPSDPSPDPNKNKRPYVPPPVPVPYRGKDRTPKLLKFDPFTNKKDRKGNKTARKGYVYQNDPDVILKTAGVPTIRRKRSKKGILGGFEF